MWFRVKFKLKKNPDKLRNGLERGSVEPECLDLRRAGGCHV